MGTTVPSERVDIGRGHTEISFLWGGVYSKGTVGAFFSFAFVVGKEKDRRFLGTRLQCRGWDRLVGDGGFGFLNRFADHGLARNWKGEGVKDVV